MPRSTSSVAARMRPLGFSRASALIKSPSARVLRRRLNGSPQPGTLWARDTNVPKTMHLPGNRFADVCLRTVKKTGNFGECQQIKLIEGRHVGLRVHKRTRRRFAECRMTSSGPPSGLPHSDILTSANIVTGICSAALVITIHSRKGVG